MSVKLSKQELRAARLRAMGFNDSAQVTVADVSQQHVHLSNFEKRSMSSTVWDVIHRGGGASEEDMKRWYTQGFHFSDGCAFGLLQNKMAGGPCGVLAAVQAEILRYLFFGSDSACDDVERVDSALAHSALTIALYNILSRCASTSHIYFVTSAGPDMEYQVSCSVSKEDALSFLSKSVDVFKSPMGCICFLLSAVHTRGLAALRSDMDEISRTLIGQFGHCTQETINLLLTGRATSNAFDGDIPLGDSGLLLKGVSSRPVIGYLSILESFRMCKVGIFYKAPEHPIWVVGSTSHFTVLFSTDRSINEVSSGEQLLARVKQSFQLADPERCGFIQADQLEKILLSLGLIPAPLRQEHVAELITFLQLDGGIILWSSFWENISQLMTGIPIDTLLNKEAGRVRSDSEFAMELSKSTGVDDFSVSNRLRSDSEIAREMQAQWSHEDDAKQEIQLSNGDKGEGAFVDFDRTGLHRHDSLADDSAEKKTLYHFNGLQSFAESPKLSKILISIRSTADVVGKAISLDELGAESSGTFSVPCEEVLRTRWPGCRVDFLGLPPPLLD